MSWAHAQRIEAQLREEVQALMRLAEQTDQADVPDGMDVPAEIARREDRLTAIAQAKVTIEQRAAERHALEQQAYEAKQAQREAQRQAGKKPRGKEPQPPQAGPRDNDQVNLTDEQSRIMPVSGGGFGQCYNAQAAVDTETMMVLAQHVSQAPNDVRELTRILGALKALPEALGTADTMLADTGYFSVANVEACEAHGLVPLLSTRRDPHHRPLQARFAADPRALSTEDPVKRMKHRLATQAGRAVYALRKQTVEPVFGIIKHVMGWRQMSLRGLEKVQGEWSLMTMVWNIKRMHRLQAA